MLLEVLQKAEGKRLELYVMYDVACTLRKHLEVRHIYSDTDICGYDQARKKSMVYAIGCGDVAST